MVLHRIFMRNEKEVIQMQTRREFLKKSAALLGSAAVVGSVPGLLKAQAEDGQEVPAYPYPLPLCRTGSGIRREARL